MEGLPEELRAVIFDICSQAGQHWAFDDPRMKWVEVQVDKVDIDVLLAALAPPGAADESCRALRAKAEGKKVSLDYATGRWTISDNPEGEPGIADDRPEPG